MKSGTNVSQTSFVQGKDIARRLPSRVADAG